MVIHLACCRPLLWVGLETLNYDVEDFFAVRVSLVEEILFVNSREPRLKGLLFEAQNEAEDSKCKYIHLIAYLVPRVEIQLLGTPVYGGSCLFNEILNVGSVVIVDIFDHLNRLNLTYLEELPKSQILYSPSLLTSTFSSLISRWE